MGSGASRDTTPPPGSAEEARLRIGEVLHDAEVAFDKGDRAAAFALAKSAHGYLERLAVEAGGAAVVEGGIDADYDHYYTMIHAREGKLYFRAEAFDKASPCFEKAIQRAEVRIAKRCRGLYLLLQRYTECMVDRVKIWEIEADKAAAAQLEKSKSAAASGSNIQHTDASKRQQYAKCELGLLRCIEMIEEGHNRRSDMLIVPLTRLSLLYEKLHFYKKAELLLRRCQGVIIVQFGYDHHDLKAIDAKLVVLEKRNEHQVTVNAAIKIQSIARMAKERRNLEARLGRRVPRHTLAPPAIRNERDKGEYLTKISNLLEPGTAMGHEVVGETGLDDGAGGEEAPPVDAQT